MTTRARGLWIIARTLAPALAVVVLALASSSALASMRDSSTVYGAAVSAELATVSEVFREVGLALGQLAEFVSAIGTALADAFRAIAAITPRIEIPPFSFDIPGLGVITEFFRAAADAAAAVTGSIRAELEEFLSLPESIEKISAATARFGVEVRDAAGQWLVTVVLMAALVAAAWMATRAGAVMNELSRGWSMLLGRPASPASVAALRARLRDLERDLAGRR
jgi:hypothetical protein